MVFYYMFEPNYETDQAEARANPLSFAEDVGMPSLQCDMCGEIWSADRYLFYPITNTDVHKQLKRLDGWPIPVEQWYELAPSVKMAAQAPVSYKVKPGDFLGVPRLEIRRPLGPGIYWGLPGQMFATESVVELFYEYELTGFEPVLCEITKTSKRTTRNVDSQVPTIYFVRVTGQAWTSAEIVACSRCGRITIPSAGLERVDQTQWDGSDFFLLDDYSRMICVTQRVLDVMSKSSFDNFVISNVRPI